MRLLVGRHDHALKRCEFPEIQGGHIRAAKVGACEFGAGGECEDKIAPAQVGAFQIGIKQNRFAKVRVRKLAIGHPNAVQVGEFEIASAKGGCCLDEFAAKGPAEICLVKLGAPHVAGIELDAEQRGAIDLGKGKVAAPEARLVQTRESELCADVACVVDERTILENHIAHIDVRKAAPDQADLGQASVLQAGSCKLDVAQNAFRQRRAGQVDLGEVEAGKISVFDNAARFEFHHISSSRPSRASKQ
uniref:hypothetical protein n=1 Tax=Sphingopyxis sp. MSC1_008 TaxID=2909265 RepID=UPI0020C0BDFA|nr:hypothetical protein [Sphingopyxis sp. MSC1_008]